MTKTKLYQRGRFHSSARRRNRKAAKQNNHPARYPVRITDYDRRCAVQLRAMYWMPQ